MDMWESTENYAWLQRLIEKNLPYKKICIVVWDEEIIGQPNAQLATVLNQYIDQPVYLVSALDEPKQEIYRRVSNIQCKILQLPWWLLNDTLTYYAVKKTLDTEPTPGETAYQYLCMIGNAVSKHKSDLVEYLRRKDLHRDGLITVMNFADHPAHFRDFVVENAVHPYKNTNTKWDKMAAQTQINGVWISSNVENFLHIERTYDMPLIIHPETSPGIFQITEKSLWPSLLGKMYLIYGGPGCMADIQQFNDVQQSKFADTRFDSKVGDYTEQDYLARLDAMLDDNLHLVKNAREIYFDLQWELENARWTIGRNLYDFFLSQLDKIQD
jgi:hypothetical protein